MSMALQRVVVRLLHDPAFAHAVFSGANVPELTEHERALLLDTDPRAFRTDPYRRSRVLQSLIEEHPCAVALASDGGRDLSRIDAFLSSPSFHTTIQSRQSLALAFGTWLTPQAPGVADLETAIARARRWRRPRGPGLALATGAQPVALPAGALARWQALTVRLGPAPLHRLVEEHLDCEDLPPLGDTTEHWVVVRQSDGSTGLVGGSEGTHVLLEDARSPQPARAFLTHLADLGAAPSTAESVLADLVTEGLLA